MLDQKTSLTTAQYERSRVNKQKAKDKLAQKKRQGAMVLLPCAVEQKNKPTYPKTKSKDETRIAEEEAAIEAAIEDFQNAQVWEDTAFLQDLKEEEDFLQDLEDAA